MYAPEPMPRTVILSEETLRALLEANASLAAWYHEFVRASREQTPVNTPGDVTRKAFLDRLAVEHPEVAALVSTMQVPPVYVPPPLGFSAGGYGQAQPPAAYGHPQGGYGQQGGYAQHGGHADPQAPQQPAGAGPAQPPMVNPRLVKY